MILDDPSALAAAAADASRASGHTIRFEGERRLNPAVGAARFRLSNGLAIVVAPDFRAPVFAYQTWFRVGSKHEDPARTGLAHLFEHLMFKGTKRHKPGEFDREMERRGTQTNAATWVDWTYYHEALAARGDNFETVVDYEVDRMTGLVLDRETFASELEVVKNERRMAVEDSIMGTLSERLYALAYREHPYRWPTIGSMAHLHAASLDDLERFYRTYYAPNNAAVVVTGALELVPTLTLLARRYGPLLAQPVPAPSLPPEPVQEAPRDEVIERAVVLPQLCIGYHTPAQAHPDFTAVQMLGETLVEGDNARLYRRLVTEEKLAASVEGALMPFADPGLYEIFVTARPGVDPKRIVAVVQEEVGSLGDRLAPAEEDKARASLELAFFDGFKSAIGIAESLGHHEAAQGDYAMAFQGYALLRRVTRADLSRVAAWAFRAENRTTITAVPGAEEADDA